MKAVAARRDGKLDHVIINEKKDARALKFTVPALPHPFQSIDQYDRQRSIPLGPEWNTETQHKKMTRPRVSGVMGDG